MIPCPLTCKNTPHPALVHLTTPFQLQSGMGAYIYAALSAASALDPNHCMIVSHSRLLPLHTVITTCSDDLASMIPRL